MSALLLRHLIAVWRTPVGWIMACAFLAIQGYSLFSVVALATHPTAPHSEVFNLFWGGTFVYWLFVIALVAALTMRSIAGERRSGALENWLASGATPGRIVVGRYLGALVSYTLLWLPTLLYLPLIHTVAGPQSFDLPPALLGFAGNLLIGAAFIGIGVAVSAWAPTQLTAALLTFLVLASLLLIAPLDLYLDGSYQQLIGYFDVFRHMDDYAAGIADLRRPTIALTLALASLWIARNGVARQTPHQQRALRRWLTTSVAFAALGGLNVAAYRHAPRLDLTQAGTYTLPAAAAALAEKHCAATEVIVVTTPPMDPGPSVFRLLKHNLLQFQDHCRGLETRFVDPIADPARARLQLSRFGVDPSGAAPGVVLIARGKKQLVLRWEQLADVDYSGPVPKMRSYRGSGALAQAWSQLGKPPKNACFSTGHGEPSLADGSEAGISAVGQHLAQRGLAPKHASLKKSPRCALWVLFGPTRAFDAEELQILGSVLDGGGKVWMLSGPVLDAQVTRFGQTGLESLMAQRGLKPLDKIIVDPMRIPGEPPWLSWGTMSGYTSHPAARDMAGKLTLWPLARVIQVAPRATTWAARVVTHSGDRSWAESNLQLLQQRPTPGRSASAMAGPLTVVGATERGDGRMVVWGTERGLLNRRLGEVARHHNRTLMDRTIDWLLAEHAPPRPEAGAHAGKQLVLTEKGLQTIFYSACLGLPGLLMLIAIVVWRRRR